MTALLLVALLATAALAALFAVRASRLGVELGQASSARDSAIAEAEEMSARLAELPEIQQRLAAVSARLEEVEAERDRLLGRDGERAEKASEHMTRLRSDLASIKGELPKILDHSSKAASGAERVETSMTTWTRRIANPQSRGSVRRAGRGVNQLKSLGLEPGSTTPQVAGDDGRLRPDFVVRLGDASVVIDAKLPSTRTWPGSTRRSTPTTPSACSATGASSGRAPKTSPSATTRRSPTGRR